MFGGDINTNTVQYTMTENYLGCCTLDLTHFSVSVKSEGENIPFLRPT